MPETYDMANKERNILRGKVRALQQENGELRAFFAEWEAWLEARLCGQKQYHAYWDSVNWKHNPDDEYASSCLISELETSIAKFNELKAKHIQSEEVTG